MRSDKDRKGKLVPKAEGPYLPQGFTDNTQQMAIIADANGVTWTTRVADLRCNECRLQKSFVT